MSIVCQMLICTKKIYFTGLCLFSWNRSACVHLVYLSKLSWSFPQTLFKMNSCFESKEHSWKRKQFLLYAASSFPVFYFTWASSNIWRLQTADCVATIPLIGSLAIKLVEWSSVSNCGKLRPNNEIFSVYQIENAS